MEKQKVALFGGTFDPIHIGHIHLALCMKEAYSLDRVVFSPAYCSPFKVDSPPEARAKDRVHMVELAIQSIEGFSLDMFESKREEPSYTIELINHFLEKNKAERIELYLILEHKTALGLESWKSCEEIFQLATPLIGSDKNSLNELNELPARCKIKQIPAIEISSTIIRNRLKKNLYCGHLLHGKVLDYISQNELYSLLT